ncbi:hypothetical protein V1517DRAFT_319665 [Lipomyces orientalis]|uniref:Uncharacterized protein n=1 Tax=Lipomyces orientalis TaxID=1233043 RepID=A0ACC3TSP1_9ASCO
MQTRSLILLAHLTAGRRSPGVPRIESHRAHTQLTFPTRLVAAANKTPSEHQYCCYYSLAAGIQTASSLCLRLLSGSGPRIARVRNISIVMRRTSRPLLCWPGLVSLLLLVRPALADDNNLFTYCSSQNTGSGFNPVYNTWQSYGACLSTCQSEYALAILQDFQCWCSNEAPGDSTELSLCSVDSCPGYPSDPCGNLEKGLYGYISIAPPSGTAGASSPSSTSARHTTSASSSEESTSTEPPTTSEPAETSTTDRTSTRSSTTDSSTESSTTSSSLSSSISSTTSSSQSSSSMSASSSTTDTPTLSLIVSVTTVAGATKTLLITQTVSTATFIPSPSSSTTSADSSATGIANSTANLSSSSFWDSRGKVAGTFVAVGVVALLLVLLLVFLLRRRRRRSNDEDHDATGKAPHTPPMNVPPLSKYGFSSNRRRRSTSTLGPRAATLDSEKHHSTAVAAAGYGGAYSAPPPPTERFQVDQRIDPGTMYVQYHDNYSRGSLRDEYDYSRRVLKVLNPDEE